MCPKEGSYVLFYDEYDKLWKKGYILVYTEKFSNAVIELEDGSIVVMPSNISYRILKNDRSKN